MVKFINACSFMTDHCCSVMPVDRVLTIWKQSPVRHIRGAPRIAIGITCVGISHVWRLSAGERATKKPGNVLMVSM
jgi:hypothetical protein